MKKFDQQILEMFGFLQKLNNILGILENAHILHEDFLFIST